MFHPRQYLGNKFVYPVLSRRSEGISIGVNLNPDKVCNFDCIYCQVDRRSESETTFVETDQLFRELRETLELVLSGEIYRDSPFDQVPGGLRRLNDIAFSGDGEPTTFRNFDAIIEGTSAIKRSLGGFEAKLVLITNASMFHRPIVQQGLRIMDQNQGEVWAKLDAGTEEYYRLVERTVIPFRQILENILLCARERPIVIQSLFMTIHGDPPSASELEAFCDRLLEIKQQQGQIKLVQIYTVARPPAESFVGSLAPEQVTEIADLVQTRTGIPARAY